MEASRELQSVTPTRIRHQVLALVTVMAVLLYLDRVCIGVAVLAISGSLGLTAQQSDWVLAAFFLAYGLGQIPAGWLGDRLGARGMLTGSVLAWSIFTAVTGLSWDLATLIAARLLFGLSQAGAYPIAGRVNSLWMPFYRRAFSSGVITLGGRAGGALAPWLTAKLILEFGDWRPVLWGYSVLGAIWAAVFWWWFREQPAEHPWCNAAEIELINGSSMAPATSQRASGLPWKAALSSPGLWMQNLMQFVANVAWVFLITLMPRYLQAVYDVDLAAAGRLSSWPLFGAMAGSILGGLLTDRLTRRVGLRWGRAWPGIGSRLLAAAGYVAAILADDPYLATAGLVFAAFTADLGLAATWAYFQDTGGPYVGTFLGWANMFGNFGAFLSPIILGHIARTSPYGWSASLATGAALYLVAGVCWLGIDARAPIVRPNAGQAQT